MDDNEDDCDCDDYDYEEDDGDDDNYDGGNDYDWCDNSFNGSVGDYNYLTVLPFCSAAMVITAGLEDHELGGRGTVQQEPGRCNYEVQNGDK